MAEVILGIPAGYYALFGGVTALNMAAMGLPAAIEKSNHWFQDKLYYYKTYSAVQEQDMCYAIFIWLATHQFAIPAYCNGIMKTIDYIDSKDGTTKKKQIILPPCNTDTEIKTSNGSILVNVLSDGINILGFRLSVYKRNWLFWLNF